MSSIYLTNASPGAPQLTIADGTLVAILDWALPQNGWGIEFSSGTDRIYRAGTGKRLRLQVRDSAAASGSNQCAVVRGCESATSATALVDPFPLVSQVPDANCNWFKGVATNPTTVRRWRMIVTPRFFWMAWEEETALPANWEIGFFGECPASNIEDEWDTLIAVRNAVSTQNNASSAQNPIISQGSTSSLNPPSNPKVFFAREITGATKSTRGWLSTSGSGLGDVANAPAARAGYANALNREQVAFSDLATQGVSGGGATRLMRRCWWPNAWSPMHFGASALTADNTWSDTEYNPSASFIWIPGRNNNSVIMETTNTWVAPVYG